MIEVDGSFGEGGGQILRTSLALAAALGKDVRISKIRAGRSEPGIRAQHLTAASALGRICNGSFEGLKVGSTDIVFKPGRIAGGQFQFDVGTAGSVTLVLQGLMPVLPFAPPINLELRGGTDVKWSPPVDYLQLVTLPILSAMGVHCTLRKVRRGHYPRGGGLVTFDSMPSALLNPIKGLHTGPVVQILGVSHVAKLPRHIAERQAEAADHAIRTAGLPAPKVSVEITEGESSLSPGSGIMLAAGSKEQNVLGGDSLGERGKPAEKVGEEAGKILVEEIQSSAFLDRHMGDMIVPYMVLASGVSEVSVSKITQHTITNVKVAEIIADVRFDPIGELGKPGRLRVRGVGLNSAGFVVSAREPIQTRNP
jgi:RNA 3'-terminal phosphate cyclase (ATP)